MAEAEAAIGGSLRRRGQSLPRRPDARPARQRPFRLTNFAGSAWASICSGSVPAGRYRFAAEETKTRAAVGAAVSRGADRPPGPLSWPLAARSCWAKTSSDRLWISSQGTPLIKRNDQSSNSTGHREVPGIGAVAAPLPRLPGDPRRDHRPRARAHRLGPARPSHEPDDGAALQPCRAAAGRVSLARGAAAAAACRRAAPAREKAMQAVIYARYSSDAQREASIEDQVRLCRELAERQGWEVAEVYADHALSGASALRPGYQRLLEDVRAGRFEVVVAEGLDRLEPRPGAHRRPVQAARLRRRAAGDRGRGRDRRAACRAQGHDERALPQGPGAEDPSRPARPGRAGPLRRRALLRLRRGAGRPGSRRHARARPAPDRARRGRDRAADLPGVRRRPLGQGDRPGAEPGRRSPARMAAPGARARSPATPPAAPASSTTSSTSAGWSGTGCATSRTRAPASACRGSTIRGQRVVVEVPGAADRRRRALAGGQGAAGQA